MRARRLAIFALLLLSGCAWLFPFPDLAPDAFEPEEAGPPLGDGARDGDNRSTPDVGVDGAACDGCALPGTFRFATVIASDDLVEQGALLVRRGKETAFVFSGDGNWDAGTGFYPDTPYGDDIGIGALDGGALRSVLRVDHGDREVAYGAASDAYGDTWVTAYARGSTGADASLNFPRFFKMSPNGTILVKGKVGPKPSSTLLPAGISVSNTGHVAGVVIGRGTIQYTKLDDSTATLTTNDAGNDDLFVMRLEPLSGKVIWIRQIGTEVDERFAKIAVDNDGDVYITGSFDGPSLPALGLTRIGARGNAFVARLAANDGSVLWSQGWGDSAEPAILGPKESPDLPQYKVVRGNAIAVDVLGNLAVGGAYRGTVDFAGDKRVADLPGFFVQMLDAKTGIRKWSRYGRGPADDGGMTYALAFDEAGSLAAGGSATGATLGTGTFEGTTFETQGLTAWTSRMRLSDGFVYWTRSIHATAGAFAVKTVSTMFDANGWVLAGIEVSGKQPTTIDFGLGKTTAVGFAAVVGYSP